MFLLTFFLFIFSLGYFFTALYLISHPQPEKTSPAELPRVAVLVAMRDEQEYIEGCLTSLKNQDYPKQLYDVYIIDDRSTDNSAKIAKRFLEYNENFHLLTITEDKDGLKGKMNALAQALEKVEHEWILITDADCIVPTSWIKSYTPYFQKDTAMVAGLTMLEAPTAINPPKTSKHFFGKVQALDWLFLQTIAAKSSNAGKPISVLGNNFAFRNEAYEQVGGFKNLGFSVTEDFALMKAIQQTGKWTILHTLDPGNTIFSYPLHSVKDFFRQRWRWMSGGRGASGWSYFIVGLSVMAHLLMLLVFIFQQWNLGAASGIGLIAGVDYLIISRELKKLHLEKLKKYFIPFEIFYLFYLIIFSVLYFIPRRVKWKGRRF